MNLHKILATAVLGLTAWAATAEARYVFALPSASSGASTLIGYSEQYQTMGTVIVPVGASQVFVDNAGSKAVVVAQNSASPVSFITIASGAFSGGSRSLGLEGQTPTVAALSSDGSRLLVVTGGPTSYLYVVDIATEQLVVNGKISIGNTAKDLVVTQDGLYAVVMAAQAATVVDGVTTYPTVLTAVNLSTLQVSSSVAVSKMVSSSPIALSLAPTGALFATGQYLLAEFYITDGKLVENARTQVFTTPGKLMFSPDGRYALAANRLGNGSSLLSLDLQKRDNNNLAGTQIGTLSIGPVGSTPVQIDQLVPVTSAWALGYSASNQTIYSIPYPALTGAVEWTMPGVGILSGVLNMTSTNEQPAKRVVHVSTGNMLYFYDVVGNQTTARSGSGGPVAYAAQPSTAPGAKMVTFGGGQTVGPNVKLRPYYVRVTDANDRPAFNQAISFVSPGVTLTNQSTVTNVDGYATVTAISPQVNGTFTVSASSGAALGTIDSTVIGVTGVTGGTGSSGPTGPTTPTITKTAGDGQLVMVQFSQPAAVEVQILDASGAPLAGKLVSWNGSDGVSFISPTTTYTDSNGKATVEWRPNGTVTFGIAFLSYSITASSEYGNVTFSEVGFPNGVGSAFTPSPSIQLIQPTSDNLTMTVKLGTKYTGAVVTQVLTDPSTFIGIVPIPGVGTSVTTGYTDPKTGPVAKCDGGVVLSGNDGLASCDLIVTGTTGVTNLSVIVGGSTQNWAIRLNVNPGDAALPTILQGNNQSGKPGATLPLALVAKIADSFGNPLSGVAAAWTVVTPNSVKLINTVVTSDTSGRVSTQVQLGQVSGNFQVTLTAAGKTVTFNVTVINMVAGFTKVGGDNQTGVATGAVFPQPLEVLLTDSTGAPLANTTVSWAVASGSASLAATTSVSGSTGRAQMTVTAGPTAGPITVSASVGSVTPVYFSLTSRPPGPSVQASSFMNFASNEQGIAPGNLVRIVGSGLASSLGGTVSADLLYAQLPYSLAGLSVQFVSGTDTWYAPILRVSNDGVSQSAVIQVPFEVPVGTVNAVVAVNGGTTTVTGIKVNLMSPGVLEETISGRTAAVAIRADGLVVTPNTPARRGEIVRMYAVGLGATNPTANTNRVGLPDQNVLATVTVGLDGGGITPISVQMAENLIGVYEITFQIPANALYGDRPLGLVTASGSQAFWSNGSVIAVGQ